MHGLVAASEAEQLQSGDLACCHPVAQRFVAQHAKLVPDLLPAYSLQSTHPS